MSWIRQASFLVLFYPFLVNSSEIISHCNSCHLPMGVLKHEFSAKEFEYIFRRLRELRDSNRDTVMHGYLNEYNDNDLYVISKELETIYNK